MLNTRIAILVLGTAVAADASTRAQAPASLAAQQASARAQPQSESDRVLVRVNGESLTGGALNDEVVQRGGGGARMGPSEPIPQLIVDVLDAILLVQQGSKKGCAVSDGEIQALADTYRKLYHLDTQEQWEGALQQQHLTDAAWRVMKRKQGIIQCVQRNEVLAKVPVTDEEASEYYRTHLNEFTSNGTTIPFDQARERINQRADTPRRRTAYLTWLERLRSEAMFEWQDADLKRAYDEGLSKK
jgi:hypothetical protein